MRWNSSEAVRFVEGNSFGLPIALLHPNDGVTELDRPALQLREQTSGDTAPSSFGNHIHAPDLCNLSLHRSQSRATHRLPAQLCDEKRAPRHKRVIGR